MFDLDYVLLAKVVPEFSKYLLNQIEKNISLEDAEGVYRALNDYQKFREILVSNDIVYSNLDEVYNELEKEAKNVPEPFDSFNKKVIENYKKSSR